MKTANKHLEALQDLSGQIKAKPGDDIVVAMIPHLAALVVILAEELDNTQRKIVVLTWVLIVLTVLLVLAAVIQLCPILKAH